MGIILKRAFGMLALLVAALLLIGGGSCVLLTLPAVLMHGELAVTLIGLFVVALGWGAWRLGLRAWRHRPDEPALPERRQP